MPFFSPNDLASWTGGSWSGRPVGGISGFAIDSRQVRPGEVFFALRRETRDGHDFVDDALARGAVAVCVARPFGPSVPALVVEDPERALQACAREHRRRFPGPVVGITGSCGKTSTKDLLHRFLGRATTLATEANLNNTLGVPLTLLRLDPEVHHAAVIEAGINQGREMDLLAGMIEPTHAIVTMIGLAHAEALGGKDGIAREKAKLPAAVPPSGRVVFPVACRRYPPFHTFAARCLLAAPAGDDPGDEAPEALVRFSSKLLAARTDTQTETDRDRQRHRDRQSTQTEELSTREGTVLEIAFPGLSPFSLILPPMTAGMMSNVVLAATMAVELGRRPAELQEALAEWHPSPRRGETVRRGAQTFYVDCYNANPSSSVDALHFFTRRFAEVPKLFVLASMRELGDFRAAGHEEVGAALSLGPNDRAVFIGESREELRAGAEGAGNPPAQLECFATTEEAAASVATFEGAILLKGSRAYGLERLLPAEPDEAEREGLAC